MPRRPLLILPTPDLVAPPRLPRGGATIQRPGRKRQEERIGPAFARLRQVLTSEENPLTLRHDPNGLAPERVVVFEVAKQPKEFAEALSRVRGFEFISQSEIEFAADDDFVQIDDREGRKGELRTDKPIKGRYYLGMPDVQALRQLLSLWDRWQSGKRMQPGQAPFSEAFNYLHTIRAWGPPDRIPDETIQYWREEAERYPDRSVRTEVELWFRRSEQDRQRASRSVRGIVAASGGTIIHEAAIPEIAYHALLIDIPGTAVRQLQERTEVGLTIADDVMMLLPQSLLVAPIDDDVLESATGNYNNLAQVEQGPPVSALFDGVPITGHQLLSDRMIFDDPDDLQASAPVSKRWHGTEMASLLIHGDLNDGEPALTRPVYVRPILLPSDNDLANTPEVSDRNRLIVDVIYRAIVRMKDDSSGNHVAPDVFMVNLSLGDPRRPFSGSVGPLARVLDFLAYRYRILFLVSAGNIRIPLSVPRMSTWTEFEDASREDRQRAVVDALHHDKHQRSMLSPAEALNALTIGALHKDSVNSQQTANSIDPFFSDSLPTLTSALGLGYRRSIKPELYFPGGRTHVSALHSGDVLKVRLVNEGRLYGLRAAVPGSLGEDNKNALVGGTSAATALATRAAHQIFDALMDTDGGSLHADMDPRFYSVVVKALLVHRAKWTTVAVLVHELSPANGRNHNEHGEDVSRFFGFGAPDVTEACECASGRATLIGYGEITADQQHLFRIPLPPSIAGLTVPRHLTVTLAWLTPVNPAHQSYRRAKLEAAAVDPKAAFGVERGGEKQPPDMATKRGTVFHERFSGHRAVAFLDNGFLTLRVWCLNDAGELDDNQMVPYGLAVTVETEADVPIYDEIQQRLLVRPRI